MTYLPYSKREAFEQLRLVAKEAEPVEFDMSMWLMPATDVAGSLITVLADGTTACGTQGCLLGHAVCRSWFRDRGLQLAVCVSPCGRSHSIEEWSPVFKDGDPSFRMYDAPAEFFRIEVSDAKYLFSPDEYDILDGETALDTALVRIEEFIASLKPEDSEVR